MWSQLQVPSTMNISDYQVAGLQTLFLLKLSSWNLINLRANVIH